MYVSVPRHSLVPCKGFKQYQYSMYVSIAFISMQGFQTILVLNVCQYSKRTHYHARVSNNISTQCMSVFQSHSFVTCKGFKRYQYSMYVVFHARFQTILVLNVCQCSKGTISTMQGFQTILVLNVCQCSKGTRVSNISTMYVMHRVSNNISTQCMSVFQRHSLVPCKGFKQYQYSMYVSVPKALISTMQGFQAILVLKYSVLLISNMQGFQTILVLNVCQCSKATLL